MEFSARDIMERMMLRPDKCSSILIALCIMPKIPRIGLNSIGVNDIAKIHSGMV